MSPNPIVITFDVTEDFRAGILDRLENTAFNEFRFETGKETRPPARCHNSCRLRSLIAESH